MKVQLSVFVEDATGKVMPYAHRFNDDAAWGIGRCVFDETPEYTRIAGPKIVEINFNGKQE